MRGEFACLSKRDRCREQLSTSNYIGRELSEHIPSIIAHMLHERKRRQKLMENCRADMEEFRLSEKNVLIALIYSLHNALLFVGYSADLENFGRSG